MWHLNGGINASAVGEFLKEYILESLAVGKIHRWQIEYNGKRRRGIH
jgi:hypothetical protein